MANRPNVVVVSTQDRHYYVRPHAARREAGTYEIKEDENSGVTAIFNWDNVVSINNLTDEEMAAILSEEYNMDVSVDELEEYV